MQRAARIWWGDGTVDKTRKSLTGLRARLLPPSITPYNTPPSNAPDGAPPSPLHPNAARLVFIVLLLGEIVALSLRFDTNTLAQADRSLVRFLESSGNIIQIAIAAVVATFVIAAPGIWKELTQLSTPVGRLRDRTRPLIAHAVAFAVFTLITGLIFEGSIRTGPALVFGMAAWSIAGLVTLLTWLALVVPLSCWHSLGRRLAGPLSVGTVVALAAFTAGRFTEGLWRPLRQATFASVQALLRCTLRDVVCSPEDSIVGTSSFAVRIAPACSGYEGIGLVVVFLSAYLWHFRRAHRFPHALLLLPLGAGLIWCANVFRIALLVAVGTFGSRAVALGGFHSQAGWLAFNAVSLGLIAGARRSRLFSKLPPAGPAGELIERRPAIAYLTPLFALIVASMITSALSNRFDAFYPIRILAVAVPLWLFRNEYRRLNWSWSWSSAAIAIGVGVFAIWILMEPPARGALTSAGDVLRTRVDALPRAWAVAWLAFRVFGSVVTVPIAEELAFRGYLTRRLIAPDVESVASGRFTWLSFLGSSVLFGALHGRWLAGTIAGMFYALAWYRRGSIADAAIAHATTNALIALAVLAGGFWSLWT